MPFDLSSSVDLLMVCGRIVFKEEEVETRRMMQMNSEEKGKKGKRKTEGWSERKDGATVEMEKWKWRKRETWGPLPRLVLA